MMKKCVLPTARDAQEGLRLGLMLHDLLTREEAALDAHDLERANDLAAKRRGLEKAWTEFADMTSGQVGDITRALNTRLRTLASYLDEKRARILERHLEALLTVIGETVLDERIEPTSIIPSGQIRFAHRRLPEFA